MSLSRYESLCPAHPQLAASLLHTPLLLGKFQRVNGDPKLAFELIHRFVV